MNLDELKRIAEAATPGPWSWQERGYIENYDVLADDRFITCGDSREECNGAIGKQDDAAFIATFNPSRIAKLLAVVKAARDLLDAESWGPVHVRLDAALDALDKE
jgi:hypothetical protein